jgi:hypothetical protein
MYYVCNATVICHIFLGLSTALKTKFLGLRIISQNVLGQTGGLRFIQLMKNYLDVSIIVMVNLNGVMRGFTHCLLKLCYVVLHLDSAVHQSTTIVNLQLIHGRNQCGLRSAMRAFYALLVRY